ARSRRARRWRDGGRARWRAARARVPEGQRDRRRGAVSLSDLSIKRPVLTWMMALALATFGVLGFVRLGVDRYPHMEFPFVGVRVELEGASPTAMEDEVVDPLEEAFATI